MSIRLSLTMIVKNEAATLTKCLVSVRDLVDEIIVVDTGSSDDTKAIAQRHGARVFDLPWLDNFAAARNESIRHATGQWLFWLDADDSLDETNRGKFRALIANLQDDNTAYVMRARSAIASGSVNLVDQVRLFRNHPAICWDYRVHEQILPSLRQAGYAVRATDIVIEHSGYRNPVRQRGKHERNLRLLHLDLADRPNDPFTLYNLGWAFTGDGRWDEAVPLLQRGLQHSHPAYSVTPQLYALLTRCHHSLGQHTEAWAVCQAGQARYPTNAELRFLMDLLQGQLYYDRSDRVAARRCWTPLLQDGFGSGDTGLRSPLARHHLALLDCDEGQFTDAENHWRTILTETPSFTPAHLGLAELCLQQNRRAELVKLLSELEPLAPLDVAVLRARLHLARQQFTAARKLLEKVISQAPQVLPPYVLLSQVMLQSGDDRAAERLLRRIVEMAPDHAESWRNLAELYRRTGHLKEAAATEQAACSPCPRATDWTFTMTIGANVSEQDNLAR